MKYQYFDLGYLNGGETAHVELTGTEANVLLLDRINYDYYRRGQKYTYYGGHATQSPINISIPHGGFWGVVIDLGGYSGTVRASVRVI